MNASLLQATELLPGNIDNTYSVARLITQGTNIGEYHQGVSQGDIAMALPVVLAN